MSTISLSINVNQLSPGWIRPSGELVSVGLFGFPSESLNARAAAARHDRRWSKLTEVVISSGEPKTGEPKSQTSRVGPSGPNTCFTQKGPLSREILDGRSSGSILMEVRKRTVFQTIFCGDIPLHRPYIGLIYGRYLQFRFLKWPLKIQAMTKLRWVNWFVKCAPYVPYSNHCQNFGIWGTQSFCYRWGFHTRGYIKMDWRPSASMGMYIYICPISDYPLVN